MGLLSMVSWSDRFKDESPEFTTLYKNMLCGYFPYAGPLLFPSNNSRLLPFTKDNFH